MSGPETYDRHRPGAPRPNRASEPEKAGRGPDDIPVDPAFDNSRAFFREGYDFIGNHCRTTGSDAFRTRIMLRAITCMMGEEAARRFYDGKSFTRIGAMPQLTLRLLQDKGSVQSLDGATHAHRKRLFLDIADEGAAQRMADLFEQLWLDTAPRWRAAGRIVFHDAIVELLTETACRWVGVSVTPHERVWLADALAAMIDRSGSIGPRAWAALLRRQRVERWAARQIVAARAAPTAKSPLVALATFRDAEGRLLPPSIAAVELLNLLRPTVAVARFITFAALALHEHPEAAFWLAQDVSERSLAFAQEVRRFYPFFPAVAGRVRQAFTWRGHGFERGDWVMFGLHATNHDARLWPQPARFRPERFLGWRSHGFDLVPQGAGEARTDHRCPGEAITVALVRRALALLVTETDYEVPRQDLSIAPSRFPTLPRDGMILEIR